MGVTYKLTDNIIDFILQKKKDDEKLSCRKMVQIIQQQFQLEVSKSSINAIFKSASLSNPVGRQTGLEDNTAKPFQIPAQTKKELFKSTIVKKKISPPIEKSVAINVQRPSLVMSKEKIPEFKENATVIQERTDLLDGMGVIFLKAAEWDLFVGQNPAQIFLKDHISDLSIEDLLAFWQTLVYLKPFELNNLDGISNYRGRGLWTLNNLSSNFDYRAILDFVQRINASEELTQRFFYELAIVAAELNYVKVFLENGGSISLDAQNLTLWQNTVPSHWTISNAKTLSNLSKLIISNREPLILYSVPGQSCFGPQFADLVSAFENTVGKRITKVSLFDDANNQISDFSVIPEKRRFLIAGVRPWQKEFNFLEDSKGKQWQEGKHPLFSTPVYFAEIDPPLIGRVVKTIPTSLRGCAIKENLRSDPFVILLTNLPKADFSTEKVAAAYLSRWPNSTADRVVSFLESPAENKEGKIVPTGTAEGAAGKAADIFTCTTVFLTMLAGYGQRHFFPPDTKRLAHSEFLSLFCSIPGHYAENSQRVSVILTLPLEKNTHRNLLTYAVTRVNESDIRDYAGRRLVLTLA